MPKVQLAGIMRIKEYANGNEATTDVAMKQLYNGTKPEDRKTYSGSTLGYDHLYTLTSSDGSIKLAGSMGGEITGITNGNFNVSNNGIAAVLAVNGEVTAWGKSGGNENKIRNDQSLENEKSDPWFAFGTQHGIPFVEVSFLHGGAITPGPFVIYPKGGAKDPFYNTHEPGHVLQFFLLGTLYYPLVAFPSLITATFFPEKHNNMPWEESANQLWYWYTGENDPINPLYSHTKK